MKNSLAVLGGVNVEGGQKGHKGLFLPTSLEVSEWEQFLNRNDTVQPRFVPLDEMDFTYADEPEMPVIDDLPFLVNDIGDISDSRIMTAAEAVLQDPHLLIDLYEPAFTLWHLKTDEKKAAQAKLLNLMLRIVAAMVQIEGLGAVTRALTLRSEDGATLLKWFIRDARNPYERHEGADAARARRIATAVLDILGHPDPYARYLD